MHCLAILKKLLASPEERTSEETTSLFDSTPRPNYQATEATNEASGSGNAGEISSSKDQREIDVEETPSSEQKNKLIELYNYLIQNPKILWQAIIYATSDAGWSGWSYAKNDYSGHPTENESFDSGSQWFGQLFFASVITFLVTLTITLGIAKRAKKESIQEIWLYFAAASLGICIWQLLQVNAEKLADKFHISATNKEYFANFTSTIPDGLSEAVMLFIGEWIINKKRPISIELGLNALTGIFSSVGWQGLYLLGVLYKLGAISTAALVAGPLTLFNIAAGLSTQIFMESKKNTTPVSAANLLNNIPDRPTQSANHENQNASEIYEIKAEN